MLRSCILLSLAIICAISWTGLALRCLRCQTVNGKSCQGVSVECPYASTKCIVVSEIFIVGTTTYNSIRRDCHCGQECHGKQYLSDFDKYEMRENVQCCSADNCNNGPYNMPPPRKMFNGKQCPACIGNTLVECKSTRTIRCMGIEDKCLNLVTTIIDPGNNLRNVSLKGCIYPTDCEEKFKATIGVKENKTLRFDCT